VYGDAWVHGNARVSGDARVEKYGQCIVINNLKNTITCTPNRIQIGCKDWPTLDKFLAEYQIAGLNNGYAVEEAEQTALFVKAAMMLMPKVQTSIKIQHEGREFEINLEKAKELGIIK
jgi:hypothetical protein